VRVIAFGHHGLLGCASGAHPPFFTPQRPPLVGACEVVVRTYLLAAALHLTCLLAAYRRWQCPFTPSLHPVCVCAVASRWRSGPWTTSLGARRPSRSSLTVRATCCYCCCSCCCCVACGVVGCASRLGDSPPACYQHNPPLPHLRSRPPTRRARHGCAARRAAPGRDTDLLRSFRCVRSVSLAPVRLFHPISGGGNSLRAAAAKRGLC
jgi:hypothetical protein